MSYLKKPLSKMRAIIFMDEFILVVYDAHLQLQIYKICGDLCIVV